MSFIFSAHSQSIEQTFKQHGQITLVDNTSPSEAREEQEEHSAAGSDSDIATPGVTRLSKTISRKATKDTWRDERAKWKYRKYQENRYADRDSGSAGPSRPGVSARTFTNKTTATKTSNLPTEPTTPSTPTAQSAALTTPKNSFLQRKVRGLFSKRRYTSQEGDSAIDVLWENQRGWFFFGMPLFSSQSLLNFDPSAWLNGHGKPSAVNVTNAQVPDPGWQWDWNTWYVDMSPDVDEEGWQYSFMFQNKFPWHGTHPWVHSFVRRRRWIRKRVRKGRRQEHSESKYGVPEPHKFNKDYFTVHATTPVGKVVDNKSYPGSTTITSSNTAPIGETEDVDEEIDNISILLRRLRKSTVDRDKINLVLQFMDQGGEDVFHLADEIPHILSLFLYQHSRRRLLSLMLRKMSAASDHREEHQRRDTPEFKNEKRKIDDLLRAVKATEKEVQRLEYWSDIRGVVRQGESFDAMAGARSKEQPDIDDAGWDHGWAGLDTSGANAGKSSISEEAEVEKKDKGKQAQSTVEELHSRKP